MQEKLKFVSCLLLALAVTLNVFLLIIIVHTKFKREKSENKLTLVPHYFSIMQNTLMILCLVTASFDEEIADYWWLLKKSFAWNVILISVQGTIMTLALTMDLLTALV